jgi:hypothetical protein
MKGKTMTMPSASGPDPIVRCGGCGRTALLRVDGVCEICSLLLEFEHLHARNHPFVVRPRDCRLCLDSGYALLTVMRGARREVA